MRILVSGAAMAAFALGSMSGAVAAQCHMTGMNSMSHAMPHCTAKTGPVVWFMASAKLYYMKGSAHWGKGMGMYVCRATAVARGGRPGTGMTGGSSHGTMGGSHGTPGSSMPGSAMPGSAMPSTMTMAPRPMSSSPSTMTSPMPGSSPRPGFAQLHQRGSRQHGIANAVDEHRPDLGQPGQHRRTRRGRSGSEQPGLLVQQQPQPAAQPAPVSRMRSLTAAAAALALACAATLATAGAQSAAGEAPRQPRKNPSQPKRARRPPTRWSGWCGLKKLFYRKGQAGFGKGAGSLVCRHIALVKHGRAAPASSPSPAADATAQPAVPSAMPSVESSAMPGAAMPMTTAEPSADAGGERRALHAALAGRAAAPASGSDAR